MKDLVEFPVKCMRVFGYLVPNPNAKTTITLVLSQLSIAATLIISIINYSYISGVLEYITNFESTSSMFLILSKLTFCIFYKTKIFNLIKKRSHFWNADNCSEAVKTKVLNMLNTAAFLQKVFLFQIYAMFFGVMLPSSIIEKKLPLGTFYISDDPLKYYMAWITCTAACCVGCCCLISLVLLFLSLCLEVMVQFKILCDHLERLDVEKISCEEEYKDFCYKLKVCLEHHKFLIRFIHNIQECFSIPLLIKYLTALPVSCVFMYATFESPAIGVKISRSLACFDILAQLSMYCIAATYMTHEASTIANAIYNSNWYTRHFIKLKRTTQLMIEEAQQDIKITTLGGLAYINTTTLINVVRASFSICTVLRNLKD